MLIYFLIIPVVMNVAVNKEKNLGCSFFRPEISFKMKKNAKVETELLIEVQ